MSTDINKKYEKVAHILNKAGGSPRVTDNTIKTLKMSIREENLDFLMAFKDKISLTMEELKESIAKYCEKSYTEEEILKIVKELAGLGVMFDQPNRHGLMIFQLAPIFRQYEYQFMRKLEKTPHNMELARLFLDSGEESGDFMMSLKDLPAIMKKIFPLDRTVPIRENRETGEEIKIIVDKELETPEEKILHVQDIKELIEKYDDIAVGQCYCRQAEEFVTGEKCKQNSPGESCMTLGKSARHTAKHGFARLVSKEEALDILKEIEEAGLVHKAYHLRNDASKDEVAICNCCSCCCPTSSQNAPFPNVNLSNYIAEVDQDACIGCGTCVDKCFNGVLELNDDDKAERVGEECVGCGVCAYFCPENAINLIEGPIRRIEIYPPKGEHA
jgi:ferredoxin